MTKKQILSLLMLLLFLGEGFSYMHLDCQSLMLEGISNSFKHSTTTNTVAIISEDSSRAMYVDDFHTILGNDSLENILLAYAYSREITTLLLYDLHIVHNNHDLTNPVTNVILADFISKAKTSYGIIKMGGTSENGDYFSDVINVYNDSRVLASEKFDIYNLEFEFWIDTPVNPGGYYCDNYLIPNGLPCTNTGGFQFFISALQTMNDLADNSSHGISTEAYIGWPTASQIDSIGDNLDLLRLHAYVSDPNTAFGYTDDRLLNYASGHPNVNVSIIFSAEPEFMQSWLLVNSLSSAENIFSTDWENGTVGWPVNINLDGFTYYTHSNMAEVLLEDCPNYIELKDMSLHSDTTIYASNMIELKNIVVDTDYQLTLVAPEVIISFDCEIVEGASLIIIDEDGCTSSN